MTHKTYIYKIMNGTVIDRSVICPLCRNNNSTRLKSNISNQILSTECKHHTWTKEELEKCVWTHRCNCCGYYFNPEDTIENTYIGKHERFINYLAQ